MLTPQQIAAKWLRNAQAAGPNIQAAVQAMVDADNPMAKAAAAESQWIAGCQRAAQQRKFSTRVGMVTFAEWKNAMLTKGIPNYQNGLQSGQRKYMAYVQAAQPIIQQWIANLPPRGTLQQNIARMTAMVNNMATLPQLIGGGGFGGPIMPGAGG